MYQGVKKYLEKEDSIEIVVLGRRCIYVEGTKLDADVAHSSGKVHTKATIMRLVPL